MSDGSSPWERGETVDWSTMGANKLVEIPPANTVYVVMESEYEGSRIVCIFDNEPEANSYAEVRNQFAEHGLGYDVESWPIGRPGCDSDDPYFDGPIWNMSWWLRYNLDSEIAPMVKQRWHSGQMPPVADFRSVSTGNFTVWGLDRDAVIRMAEAEASKRISAEMERLRIAEEKRLERTRFRIDSEHEFG